MHNRNFFKNDYPFPELIKLNPDLSPFVIHAKSKKQSIDFSNAQAVYELNKALLLLRSNWTSWKMPSEHLIPPIPGREDYIHHVADLLSESNNQRIPSGQQVAMLDVGTGAGLVYPILAHSIYKWSVLASETSLDALSNAKVILKAQGTKINQEIKLIHQKKSHCVLTNIIRPEEKLDLTICNPPFFRSKKAAEEANQIRRDKMGLSKKESNFRGTDSELWTPGGEVNFIKNYMQESEGFKHQVLWFTTLVSRKEHLQELSNHLKSIGSVQERVIEMKHGQKKSRILCWSFLTKEQQQLWAQFRWKKK
jgi:23S rRNA (adenine1618-N6)-methyltransferase